MESEGSHRRGEIPDDSTLDGRNGDGRLPDDVVFRVLSSRRRRRVIDHLRATDGTASVGDLAEQIAIEENDTTHQQLSSYERKRVYVSLYQNHLPMMDDVGVVDYDEHRKTVRLRESVAEFEPYLEGTDDGNGSRIRIGASLVVATTVLLGGLQVGSFATVSAAAWALVGVGGLVGVVCFGAYDRSG
jgi:hypothetical protein